ncbi:DUF4468 domain-containing protein [Xylanibacter oryzae]|uniref:DUF4468 domain-containing protein n=1 Tax=Xylanibacter oryzae TaxID=185293 RepID=UPI0004BBAAFA|nr:DUF4468 domain-containing protein [Xylanibacter oryzae]
MKRLFIVLMACMPLLSMAQNVWERPKVEKNTAMAKINPDQKYIQEGAIPEIDGKVVFTDTIYVNGKSKLQLYSALHNFLEDMTTEEGQFIGKSNVVITDSIKGLLAARYSEWLIFSDKSLALDRTQFNYQIITECKDGMALITMNRISYDYEIDRGGNHYSAEEWITDKNGLNKSKTKLSRISGKFRRKTIDRKDYLFKTIKELLTEKQ